MKVKFGDIVKLESYKLKIKESKLKELQEKYGACLSRRQMQEVQSENFENDIDSDLLNIHYEDLEIAIIREHIGVISGINDLFGFYYSSYSIHNPGFGSSQFCISHEDKPLITIDKFGIDFTDYFAETKPRILKVLSPDEIKELKISNKQKEFYSNIL